MRRGGAMLLTAALAACGTADETGGAAGGAPDPDTEKATMTDPMSALSDASTLEAQVSAAEAVFIACGRLSMTMRDAGSGDPVGFGEDWTARTDSLVVEVACDAGQAAFRPLGPEPVFILMRE